MHNDKKAYQVDRTPTELLSDLLVQLKFLRQECLHYDAGDWSYGAQIATKLRLLLHQTKYSDSLLAQITKRFAFSCPDFLSLSTVRGELPNKGRTDFVRSPLIQYQMIHQPEVPPVLTVQTWWDGIDILLIDRQHFLNRKGVVCLLANQEGGAHVQPGMDEKAALLRRRAANSLQIAAPLPDGQTRIYTAEIDQVLAAVVRTIAAETLYTFEHAILPRCQIALSADEKD